MTREQFLEEHDLNSATLDRAEKAWQMAEDEFANGEIDFEDIPNVAERFYVWVGRDTRHDIYHD